MNRRLVSLGSIGASAASVALCWAATAAGVSSSPLTLLHTGFGVAVDDRYAVFYGLDADHIRIRDTTTRRSVRYPTRCRPPGSDSFRRGYLLLDCSTPDERSYEVLRVATLSATQVRATPEGVELSSAGRHWAAGGGGDADGAGQRTVYVNWHTGEVRSDPGAYPLNPPRDLDDRQLRPRSPGRERGDPFPRRRGRYVLTQRSRGPRAGRLLLHHRGQTTRLSRCRHECARVDIVPGLVVWSEGSEVRGYALPSGRRLRWPRHRILYGPVGLATAYELFIGAYTDDPDSFRYARPSLFRTRWRHALRR